ncbi:Gfo/Idh/MocA family protein [Georgenia thermotolerans]|uniref:Gfo/Idh/MocA family oxidoreductase n=1 Tax=Georgenia thermotolerans TaxID=527326 RepID=A0A7J5UUH6_9MICO|nr:Gfo/Idh/MocA family oxidoreductase [Georgenia thermotolerans]KAE8765928.1 gfo/Idh/MocA family oxidoreductase [Georgenia thermotolerans]
MRELQVALIGGGFMGRAHSLAYAVAPLAADLGARIVPEVLVDVDADLAARQARQLGWRRSGTDWRAAITDPAIDIVDICTPPQFHEEIALAAMAAGKHVFCEKPISNSAEESRRMAAAAREAGVVTQVGFNYRHTPAISFARQLLDSGKLGAPLQFRGAYLQETAFGADPHRWRAKRATGGSGMVGDIGSHVIDMAEMLLGDVVRVAARVRAWVPGTEGWTDESVRLGEDLVDDGGVWVAEFASGVIGSFAVNAAASGRKNQVRFELDATRGAVEFNWNDKELLRVSYTDESADHRGFRTIHTNDQHPDGWWRLAGLGTGYVDVSAIQFQKFVRAILAGGQASPSFADAAHIQGVVEAIHAAAVTDRWVDVPVRTERKVLA